MKMIHFKSNRMYTVRIQINRNLFQTTWYLEINGRKCGRKREENIILFELIVNRGIEGISTKICTKR